MKHVEDRDHGWRAASKAMAGADGIGLEVGLVNPRLRYPRSAGGAAGTEIVKVAAILKLHSALGEASDETESDRDAGMKLLFAALHKGQDAAEIIYRKIGIPTREAMRAKVPVRTGRMEKAIRASVFDNATMRRRGRFTAGDDIRKPRKTQRL